MEQWKRTALILGAFGICIQFRPSEPFFIEYAVEFRNFTVPEMIHEVLPPTSYGQFVSLLILLFITDFLRYKPVIIFGAAAFVASWCISIWAYTSTPIAQGRQIVFSMAAASEVAYLTYMYSNVERKHFKAITSYIHSALHIGQFLAGLVAQTLVSFDLMNYFQLNYISLGGALAALIISFFLPKPSKSLYFYPRASIVSNNLKEQMRANYLATQRENGINPENDGADVEPTSNNVSNSNNLDQNQPKLNFKTRMQKALNRFRRDFKEAYGNRYVLKWSLWWAVAMAVYLQVLLYTEPLWRLIEEETHQKVYNGAVHSTHGLITAAISIILSFIKFAFMQWGEVYLSAISFLQGATLIVMSRTHDLYLAYACYILFLTLFETMIIVVTAEVAEGIKDDSEAFIFGLNTLIALVIKNIMSVTMISQNEFRLHIRDIFLVFGLYCAVLGFVFILLALQNRKKIYNVGA